jgi:hypothetical protein
LRLREKNADKGSDELHTKRSDLVSISGDRKDSNTPLHKAARPLLLSGKGAVEGNSILYM